MSILFRLRLSSYRIGTPPTIVFTRYLILKWERRQNNDERSLGGLFYLFVDEVMDLDLKTALRQLMAFVLDLLPNKPKNYESLSQLHNWISAQLNQGFIRTTAVRKLSCCVKISVVILYRILRLSCDTKRVRGDQYVSYIGS